MELLCLLFSRRWVFNMKMSWKAFFQDDFEMHWRLLLKIWTKKSPYNFWKLFENNVVSRKVVSSRDRNNARSSDMTRRICHLIGHKFSEFKLCLVILWTKNQIFSSYLGFKVFYQQCRNNKPKIYLFTT